VLTQEEIDGCREAFLAFDKDRSGTIDVWELRQVLEAMGQKPTEEELFQMISEVDDNMSGSIDFGEYVRERVGSGRLCTSPSPLTPPPLLLSPSPGS
jgi:calmodulin